jgi:glycosyltransferase involved in cell wall biosynthesis
MTSPRPLLVFADDWGRHPSSCQHLIKHLLPTRKIVWVNTIGTRPPRLDWGTVKRVGGKLKQWAGKKKDIDSSGFPPDARPDVVAPLMWPSFKSSVSRRVNRSLMLRKLRPLVGAMPEKPVVVTTLPIVADLVGRLPVHRWIYYCVDDFRQWPGYDGATMGRMERDLVPKIDAAVAVSDTLVSHLAGLGRPATLLTHGVDLDFWKQSVEPDPPEFAGLKRPIILFWGVIDRRTCTETVQAVAAAVPEGTVVLRGPQEAPDPTLFALPNVAVGPPVPFARLPALAAAADVLIMPYADLPVTRAIQPLKLKEYLATGKPVVVADLPATRVWADAAEIANSPADFAAAVVRSLRGGLSAKQLAARQRLVSEGWAGKAEAFASVIDGD